MGLRRSFKPTNIVQNGDFSKGTTGWGTTDPTAMVVADGVMSFTAPAQYHFVANKIPLVVNHKYYATANIKASGTAIRFVFSDDTYYTNLVGIHSGGVNFTKLSGMTTIPATIGSNNYIRVIDYAASDWAEIQVDNVLVIDLTACLPADILALSDANLKAWCDLNIPVWFDGTLSSGVINGTGGLK